jgi:hypothetical protein
MFLCFQVKFTVNSSNVIVDQVGSKDVIEVKIGFFKMTEAVLWIG